MQIRPISLCNIIAKIISKVMANRLRLVLMKIISETQIAFLPGRIISNNILIAHEVMHYMNHNKLGANPSMTIKLDMSKAYDRVEWSFLEAVMKKLGFYKVWVDWIMCIVSSVSYSFILNGAPKGFLRPSREGLTCMLRRAEEQKALIRIKVSKVLGVLNMMEVQDQGKYLGLPSQIGHTKKEVFKFVRERVDERIKWWKGKLLFQPGKEILIKAVATTIPNYMRNCFKLLGLIEGRKVLNRGVRWRVRDDKGIDIWKDPWISRNTDFKRLLEEEDVARVLPIPLSKHRIRDRIVWNHIKSGVYLTSSGYLTTREMRFNGSLWSVCFGVNVG
ncbi:hypothetical protein LIER_38260 [Lithospermum erythrorhizon]|uniref:Reverse transcriptase domain-containing protein n=1 Tax=Lithospermum erythrorhizon TaxID=34254 RepID=A0AAV3Q083_LITER